MTTELAEMQVVRPVRPVRAQLVRLVRVLPAQGGTTALNASTGVCASAGILLRCRHSYSLLSE
jgi:hypothetical protein